MPTITLDNLPTTVPAGATLLDAARAAGLDIPTLCHRDGIAACDQLTSCLVCLVKIVPTGKLVPSCATLARDGMVVESQTPEVLSARRTALELLLSDHAGDCLAPCVMVCPARMDIPRMLHHIARGEFHAALTTVKERIPLPATLGRICPELCESMCRRKQQDQSVSICRSHRFVGDLDLGLLGAAQHDPWLPTPAPDTGKTIAILGSGPAGLSAAYYLRLLGHAVTIFDDHDQPGGNLRYAIPEWKLPRPVLDAEIQIVQRLGAQFRLKTKIGAPFAPTLADLRESFAAVIIACGAMDETAIKSLGLAVAGKGLKVDRETHLTNLPGVFAAGSSVVSARAAIRAIADGGFVARAVDAFLHHRPPLHRQPDFTTKMGTLSAGELAAMMHGVEPAPRTPGQRTDTALPPGLTAAQAPREADRCLQCGCAKVDTCAFRQVSIQLNANPTKLPGQRRAYEGVQVMGATGLRSSQTRAAGGTLGVHALACVVGGERSTIDDQRPTTAVVLFEPGKCIACGKCVAITREAAEPLGLTYIGRGFDVRIGIPWTRPLAEALQKTAEACAEACPTAAILLQSPAPRNPSTP